MQRLGGILIPVAAPFVEAIEGVELSVYPLKFVVTAPISQPNPYGSCRIKGVAKKFMYLLGIYNGEPSPGAPKRLFMGYSRGVNPLNTTAD
ncbi:MAG: hypothetical protein GKS01_12785 [Alphaproteobacteria bacterium]|nr:hypothetical protein [Alphaproteobacteria bacterium]